VRRLPLIALIVVTAALLAPAVAGAAAPTVTLTDPASGSLITGGQPTFAGSGGDAPTYSGVVSVSVYSGSAASGLPTQILYAQTTNGKYSVNPAIGLSDGSYTAVASETDGAGNTGSSDAVSFAIFNSAPQITLTGPNPAITPTPTFTGTALTGASDVGSVSLLIFPGASTNSSPLEQVTATVGTGGAFQVQASPGLASGQYTAVVSQSTMSGTQYSNTFTFTDAIGVPTLAITSPAASGALPETAVRFAGAASDAEGEPTGIALSLYPGTKASGTPAGTETVNESGGRWSETWPSPLTLGTYTLTAVQQDGNGDATEAIRTFSVVAPAGQHGQVKLSSAGTLSAPVACVSGAGTCTGDLLIDTSKSLRTQTGGPVGSLRLLFVRFRIAAGKSQTQSAKLPAAVLAAVRHAGAEALRTTISYTFDSTLKQVASKTSVVSVSS
jgi:large repetitive protein